MSDLRLVADIGGTNVRAAITYESSFDTNAVVEGRIGTFSEMQQFLRACLLASGCKGGIEAVVAVAAPVTGGTINVTNRGWKFSAAELKRELGFSRLAIVNDFVAVAMAVPHLLPEDVLQVGDGEADREGPVAVIGAGTGLGIAGLVPTENGCVVIPGEGGHSTMSAADELESKVLAFLRNDEARGDGEHWNDHVSAERVLSGPGLVNLFRALFRVETGRSAPPLLPEEISLLAMEGRDTVCKQTLDMFCAMLGTVTGNCALSLGATGGVFVAGGIAPAIATYLERSAFRQRFARKGRLAGFLKNVPTYIIRRPHPALMGLALMDTRPRGTLRHIPISTRASFA